MELGLPRRGIKRGDETISAIVPLYGAGNEAGHIRVFQVIARGEEKQEEEEKEGHASDTSPKEGRGIASAVIE